MTRSIGLPPLNLWLYAACALALLLVGGAAGYWIAGVRAPVSERMEPAPAKRQADGSLILARMPDSNPAPAPHQIPPGATEMRRITATIKPKARSATADLPCDDITVTTSLVRQGDELRAITSTDSGEIVSGADVPISALDLAPSPRVWSAEALYEPRQKLYGLRVARDIGRLQFSLSALQREDGGIAPWIGVGLKF